MKLILIFLLGEHNIKCFCYSYRRFLAQKLDGRIGRDGERL